MEKHSHMKSNMLHLPKVPRSQLSQESESASYSTSEEEKGQFYGIKENPKRTHRLVNTDQFVCADSVVLQARGNEAEWSRNLNRRGSKRTCRALVQQEETKKFEVNNHHYQPSKTESWGAEPEPASSISDVAFCLMMLSRDQWKSKVHQDDDNDEETDESEYRTLILARGKYRCEPCNKVFNSYQALGGHRASHKKLNKAYETKSATCSMTRKKTRHECPVCFRVFSSGQALGGHKRSHITTHQVAATTTQTFVKSSKFLVLNLIDLNLPAPAPVDEDDDDDRFLMLK